MRIEILDEAEQDLLDGFAFYERQMDGLGAENTVISSFALGYRYQIFRTEPNFNPYFGESHSLRL